MVSKTDVGLLCKFLSRSIYGNLDGQKCHMCKASLDQKLLKLFQLAQLSLEKSHNCNESLAANFKQFKYKHEAQVTQLQQELIRMQKEKDKLQNEVWELQENNALLKAIMDQSLRSPRRKSRWRGHHQVKALGAEENQEPEMDESETALSEEGCDPLHCLTEVASCSGNTEKKSVQTEVSPNSETHCVTTRERGGRGQETFPYGSTGSIQKKTEQNQVCPNC